jgi:hypothetical protein
VIQLEKPRAQVRPGFHLEVLVVPLQTSQRTKVMVTLMAMENDRWGSEPFNICSFRFLVSLSCSE